MHGQIAKEIIKLSKMMKATGSRPAERQWLGSAVCSGKLPIGREAQRLKLAWWLLRLGMQRSRLIEAVVLCDLSQMCCERICPCVQQPCSSLANYPALVIQLIMDTSLHRTEREDRVHV